MTKTKPGEQVTSEGHKLIVELMTQLAGGKTMSPESKKRWLACLTQLYSSWHKIFHLLDIWWKTRNIQIWSFSTQ